MASPQPSQEKELAPLCIVEFYEQFKNAVKNSDFSGAKRSLQEMRQYQGGEKLAKELASDFELLQENFSHPQDPIHAEETDSEEIRAQKILSHIDLFESFLQDRNFTNADLEIQAIYQMGDDGLAQSLKKRYEQEQKKHLQKRFFQNAAQISENEEGVELEQEYENEQNTLAPEESQDFQKTLRSEFLEALEQGRSTYAQNLLKKMQVSDAERASFQALLEKKKQDIAELRRQKKVQEAFVEVQALLQVRDFKGTEKALTQCRYFMNDTEYAQIDAAYHNAVKEESANIERNSYEALLKNIEEKDFAMAHSNLKDFRKIASEEKAKAVEESLLRAEFIEKQTKKKEGSLKNLENQQKIQVLFEQVQERLLVKDWAVVKNLAREIAKLGDKALSHYATHSLLTAQEQEIAQQKAQEILQWKQDFSNFLQGNTSIDQTALLKAASKLFQRKEFYAYAQKIESVQRYRDVYIAIDEHDFAMARKIARNITENIAERQMLALHILEKEKVYQDALRQGNIRTITNAVEQEIQKQDYAAAIQLAKRLLDINARQEYQEIVVRINQEKLHDEIAAIQVEVDALKEKGLFKEALHAAEKALKLKQKSAYEQMQSAVKKEEEHFIQKKQEALFAFVLSEIQKGNFSILKLKSKQLSKDQILALQKSVLIEKQKIQEEKTQEKYPLLQEEFSYASQYGSAEMKQVLEKIQHLFPSADVAGYADMITKKEDEESQKFLDEKLAQIDLLLQIGDFHAVRLQTQSLMEKGYLVQANHILQLCLQAERAAAERVRAEKFQELYTSFISFRTRQSMTAWKEFLPKMRDFFHENVFRDHILEIAAELEEFIIQNLEAQQFAEAEHFIHFLAEIQPENALKLEIIARERRSLYLRQYQLVGAKAYIQKKSVLTHYQAWRESALKGVFDEKQGEYIERLEEHDLPHAMKQFQEYHNKIQEQKPQHHACLQITDKKNMESCLREKFSFLEKEAVHRLVVHYIGLLKHEKEQVFQKNEEVFESQLTVQLQSNHFQKARALFTEDRILGMRAERAKRFAELLQHTELSISKTQETSFEKTFAQHLKNQEWREAEALLCTLPLETMALRIRELFTAEQEAKLLELKNQNSKEKLALIQDVQMGNFVAAQERFKRLEPNIPKEIFISERKEILDAFQKSYEDSIQNLKLSIYAQIEKKQFEDAQKTMDKLSTEESAFQSFTTGFQRSESLLYQCVESVQQALKEGAMQKAHTFIDAVEENISPVQKSYLLFLIEQAGKAQYEANPEMAFQEIRQALDSLNPRDISGVKLQDISGAKQRDVSRIKQLLEQAEKDFPEQVWLFHALRADFEAEEQRNLIQTYFQNFVFLISSQRFSEAEKILPFLEKDPMLFIEAITQREQAKKEALRTSLQAQLEAIHRLITENINETLGEKLQELEESFLDALFFSGESWFLPEMFQVFQAIKHKTTLLCQEDILAALEKQNFAEALLLVQNIAYRRLQIHYQMQLQKAEEREQYQLLEKDLHILKTAIRAKDFDAVRKGIASMPSWQKIEDIDAVFLPLLEHEAQQADTERKETLQSMIQDITALLRNKQLNQAEKLLTRAKKLSVADELDECEKRIQEAKILLEKEQEEENTRTEKQKKETVKKYEKFVLEAISQYNFPEAAHFIQEIGNLGEISILQSLKSLYEERKDDYEKTQKTQELKEHINELLAQYELDEAEKLIQSLSKIDTAQAEACNQQLIRLRHRDKQEIIEERVKKLIQEKKFQEAELLLEKL